MTLSHWLGAVAAVLMALTWPRLAAARPVAATWESPVAVWESQGQVSDPWLETDAYGQAHLFFVDRDDPAGPGVLYQMALGGSSAEDARDILMNVNLGFKVAADAFGRLHVLYPGPNNTLWYMWVDGRSADEADQWSKPVQIAQASLGAGLAVDQTGGIHVCYPRDDGIYHIASSDDTGGWGAEQLVATTSASGIAVGVACAVDNHGAIHVVWSEVAPPNFYPSQGVYYSASVDGGTTWQAPDTVAGEHYTLPRIAVGPDGTVHLIWQGDVAVGGRYYRQQLPDDIGQWSRDETILPAGEGGMSGEAPMAFDSAGDVHVATAADVGIRSLTRRAGVWSEPEDLTASIALLPNASGSIEQPALAITDGNQIYAAWEFDRKRIYLDRGAVAAPAVTPPSPKPLPTSAKIASATEASPVAAAATGFGLVTPTLSAALPDFDRTIRTSSMNQMIPTMAAIIAVAIVLALAFTFGRR